MAGPLKVHFFLICSLLSYFFSPHAALPPERTLERQDARRWKRVTEVARQTAKAASRQFLEERGQELQVPMEVDVFLVGFDGDGAYGYKMDPAKLHQMLVNSLSYYCPHVWDTQEELGVCFSVHFQIGYPQDTPQVSTLLRQVEDHLRGNMKAMHAAYDDQLESGQRKFYNVEASAMEPMFDAFMSSVYGADDPANGPKAWHRHNTIFILNPSKVRINPEGRAEDKQHVSPDFLHEWAGGNTDGTKLAAEEAGYVYRYQYNGAGESSIWTSSKNYLVVDVSSGPTIYGPLISRGGSVTRAALPSIKSVLSSIMDDIAASRGQMTVQEHAIMVANHGQHSMFAGALAGTIMSAVRHTYIPDMATQHLEYAKTILIPLVVLADYKLSDEDYGNLNQENFFGMNITAIEHSVARLLDDQQEAVVISAHHDLHTQHALSSALFKAIRQHSEAVVDAPNSHDFMGAEIGLHMNSHIYLDPAALLEEVAEAAEMLTHGLTGVAHMMGKEAEHFIGRLRHSGTRVVPVFVLSLKNMPDNLILSNRELMAADHDSVVVLQLRSGARWGGPDEVYTGHMANGRQVLQDGADSARHVIAGLARALAGVVPPQARYDPLGEVVTSDWRWAVGATPFGPYSNFTGVSEITQSIARRNLLLSHTSAMLKQLQEQLNEFDAFVSRHFQGPWEAAGMSDDGRHWLDTVAQTRHGYNSTIAPDAVSSLEAALGNITKDLEEFAVSLFTHDFHAAATMLEEQLLPAAAAFSRLADSAIEAGEDVMLCCHLSHVNVLSQTLLIVLACMGGSAVFFLLLVVALCARGQRKKAMQALGLPTFGLPSYSGKSGTWTM